MGNLIKTPSVERVKFFDDFYCLGFDHEKVSKGIEDLTELRDIDKSRDWNKGIVASAKKYYKTLGITKEEVVKIIVEIVEIPIIK